ncbi:peptidylprolyl isomerase [Buchnera aphidicola (Aphis helianthi)]|uniref:Peptidylprolyl isomerase n=1 Tax=Buchnera aphidicola (Aphis helianthi) TaxID=2315802 RepID=A0A4D6XW41_9GAMM|nr:peptidylprolyl isomerase [Buchnera aphidicola]QCI16975.1 peptidylprolyl isomerase [Buchnera aphidicola (Aphis helianthi)]
MRVFFILIFYVFSSFFSNCFSKTLEIDKVLAVVNNQAILNSDVNQILFYLKQEKNIITLPLKINFLRDKILEKLIVDTLILEEANKFNITVSDAQVDIILRKIAFKKHITLKELKDSIILNNTNDFFTYEDYINNFKKSLKIKMLQDYILNNHIHISQEEIYYLLKQRIEQRNDLKKINLKFIILPFSKIENNKTIKNKRTLINNLIKIINDHSNFDYFYGIFKKNKNIFLVENASSKPLKHFKELFCNKIHITQKNKILGPILGPKGFYIIKVDDIENNSSKKIITEFHIQHCLIRPSIYLNNIQAKKDIFEIYNNIKTKNYSFQYAVKNLSHDVYSSHKKGDLGWISNKSFDGVFKNVLKHLNKQEISKPIKSSIGWHIIKLLEKRQIDETWKIEKEKIYKNLLQHKIKIEKTNWINKLKQLSYINIF